MNDENPFASPKADPYVEKVKPPRPPSLLLLVMRKLVRAVRNYVVAFVFLWMLVLIGVGLFTSEVDESAWMAGISGSVLLAVGIYLWIAKPHKL